MRPFVFADGTAVVTGAASGIGEALAHALARRGSRLVLLDRDAERLAGVAQAVGAPVLATHVVDLADREATLRVAEQIKEERPAIRLLVNNAGVALAGNLEQVTLEEFEWVIDINFRATVRLTHTLLPALRAEPGSHLVNLSSLYGIIAPPGQTAYSASKFAVRGFTEALRHELGAAVGVTQVHPGGIRTRIAQSARRGSGVTADELALGLKSMERFLRIDPAKAASIILRGVERRRARVLIGPEAYVLDALARALPVSYGKVLVAAFARRATARGQVSPSAQAPQ